MMMPPLQDPVRLGFHLSQWIDIISTTMTAKCQFLAQPLLYLWLFAASAVLLLALVSNLCVRFLCAQERCSSVLCCNLFFVCFFTFTLQINEWTISLKCHFLQIFNTSTKLNNMWLSTSWADLTTQNSSPSLLLCSLFSLFFFFNILRAADKQILTCAHFTQPPHVEQIS